MITEQYVTFDTAKMLKKAGFDCRVNRYFQIPYFSGESKEKSLLTAINSNKYPRNYSRPTQAIAARWLREVHDITVDVFFNPPKQEKPWNFFIGEMEDLVWAGDFIPSDKRYGTYEGAMEEGLRKALRLIIKKKEDVQKND